MHDLGGMDGFGPVVAERDEPPFHAPWEGRVLALARAMGFAGAWTIDEFRASIESIAPVAYLQRSYYAKWLEGLEDRVRTIDLDRPPARTLTSADVPYLTRGEYERAAAAPARFAVGERVRTRNIHPVTHTRLPRYARDKIGTVEAIRGCHVFPDTVAIGRGEQPQWLYTVVFDARALGRGRRCAPDGLDRSVRAVFAGRVTEPPMPFREPWEAQSFAMALALFERGCFTWNEWAARLAEEIQRAQRSGDPDTGATYYRHWQATLERIVAEKGLTDAPTLARYRDAWDRAADRTPHGRPIELHANDFSN